MMMMFPESVHVVLEVIDNEGDVLYVHPMLLPISAAKEFEELIKVTEFWAIQEKYTYKGSKLIAEVEDNYPQFFEKVGECDECDEDRDCDCDEDIDHDILVYNIIVAR